MGTSGRPHPWSLPQGGWGGPASLLPELRHALRIAIGSKSKGVVSKPQASCATSFSCSSAELAWQRWRRFCARLKKIQKAQAIAVERSKLFQDCSNGNERNWMLPRLPRALQRIDPSSYAPRFCAAEAAQGHRAASERVFLLPVSSHRSLKRSLPWINQAIMAL